MTSVRTLIAVAVLVLLATTAEALTLPKISVPRGVEGRAAALARHAGPKTRAFIAKEGAEQAAKGPSIGAVNAAIRNANLGATSNADIDALCFLVMAQAADDQDRDLQSVMAGVKATHGHGSLPAPHYTPIYTVSGLSNGSWDASIDNLKSQIDSQSELGESESLRLQMAMDRMSKLMDTLSNLLKKISDTDSNITQNLK